MSPIPIRSMIAAMLVAASLVAPLAGQSVVAVTGVTVIDGTGRAPLVRATILVQNGTITAVGPADRVSIPANAQRIRADGQFAIPGLWDNHVHLSAIGRAGLPALVEYGITSVRDLGGSFDSVLRWRADADVGRIRGPRIRLSGPIIENAGWLKRVASLKIPGLEETVTERIPVETEEDARRAVDSIARMGADLVKLRNAPRPAAYAALLEAARQRRLPVAGHQPGRAIGLAATLAAGQRSIEHIEGLDELEAMAAPARDSLARGFAAAQIWITPTLAASFGRFVPDSLTRARVAGTAAEPGQALVTPSLRRFWETQLAMKQYDSPLDEYRKLVVGGLAGMRRLRAAGVKVLAGTDLAGVGLYPGISLHDELAYLVDSLSLTPLQAIQSATIEPARWFGIEATIGTIEPGKLADFVLVSADPLADIRNTRRIETVVIRGEVIPIRPR